MSTFYDSMAQLATDLISEYGRPMILRKYTITGPDYAPIKTPIDSTVIGVFSSFNINDINGTLVRQDDKSILVDSAIIPDKADSVVDNGSVYEIVNIIEIKPGATGILYKLQVRK